MTKTRDEEHQEVPLAMISKVVAAIVRSKCPPGHIKVLAVVGKDRHGRILMETRCRPRHRPTGYRSPLEGAAWADSSPVPGRRPCRRPTDD